MRFLVDECTGPAVAAWLRSQSHDVFSVYDEARGMSDDDVLGKAESEGWILVTNDKDFGEMVFRERRTHRGIIKRLMAVRWGEGIHGKFGGRKLDGVVTEAQRHGDPDGH